jgi:hypothetical protein
MPLDHQRLMREWRRRSLANMVVFLQQWLLELRCHRELEVDLLADFGRGDRVASLPRCETRDEARIRRHGGVRPIRGAGGKRRGASDLRAGTEDGCLVGQLESTWRRQGLVEVLPPPQFAPLGPPPRHAEIPALIGRTDAGMPRSASDCQPHDRSERAYAASRCRRMTRAIGGLQLWR